MKRLPRQILQSVGALLAILAGVVLVQLSFQVAQGRPQPMAQWGIGGLERIVSPLSQWFIHAPRWAWISMVIVINLPGAILLTWALHVAGMGIKERHRPYWVIFFWIMFATIQGLAIRWVRGGGGGI